jgi:hypothetical protein
LQKSLHESIPDLKLFLAQFSELGDYLPQRELQYAELKRQLKDVVSAHVPHAARLIVVSKGDDDLLQLDRCSARHFPQDERGHYAGYYPQDSAEAIRNLESVRVRGADFLLFPQTAFWWLEHYTGFRQHLLDRYPLAHRDESCLMFDLRQHAA